MTNDAYYITSIDLPLITKHLMHKLITYDDHGLMRQLLLQQQLCCYYWCCCCQDYYLSVAVVVAAVVVVEQVIKRSSSQSIHFQEELGGFRSQNLFKIWSYVGAIIKTRDIFCSFQAQSIWHLTLEKNRFYDLWGFELWNEFKKCLLKPYFAFLTWRVTSKSFKKQKHSRDTLLTPPPPRVSSTIWMAPYNPSWNVNRSVIY